MHISPINQNTSYNKGFKAKFLDTPAIKEVANWAVENGKFDKLNQARKQIDYSAVKVRIHLDLATNTQGYPIAIFRRYFPKVVNPQYEKDYRVSCPIVYTGKDNKISPQEFGYKKIVQMGNYVTRNKMFMDIVRFASSLGKI